MIFDDNFMQLTGQKVDKKPTAEPEAEAQVSAALPDRTVVPDILDQPGNKPGEKWSSELGNPDFDYVIESDLVTPTIKATKNENAKPLIVAVDDDFETLDLLKIYLSRHYEYEGFSGPREAIFFLNQRIPDLILLDCKIHTMKANTFAEIIRAGAGNENVPFVYTGNAEELAFLGLETLPEYVVGTLKRPIARGELQTMLDKVIVKEEQPQ